MKKAVALIGLFTFFAFGAANAEPTKKLLRIDGLTRQQVRTVGENGFDVARAGKNFVEVVVTADEAKSLPTNKASKQTVLIPDLDAYVSKALKSQTRNTAYYTYDTMTAALKDWSTKYPKICRLESIGKSCEGRDIWGMKISDNPEKDEKEPAALVMGGTHAREWIGVEVPMEALKQLLEGYGKDEKLTQLVNEREVWFVPMVNPDGVTYSQTKSQYWRKSRRNNGNNSFGVDLNRNYGYQWGNVGASSSPNSDTYHGTKAFSEPETTAIKTLAEREHFQASISFHSYSELVLYPFGYGYNIPCPDQPTLMKLAKEMAEFNKYTPQNSADLYPCMGDSDDYMYGEHKALAFTFELATTFIPPANEIEKINKLNVPAVHHMIDKAGTYALTTPTGNAEIAAALDANTALDAIRDGSSLQADLNEEGKLQTSDRLQTIGKRLAELCAQDLSRGETATWEAIKALPAASFVKPLVRDCLNFATVHGDKVDQSILQDVEQNK